MTAAPRKPSVSIPTPPPTPKSKPRVRAYMIEHRAAVRERLVDQEAEGLRQLNLGRDQILARLWELANPGRRSHQGHHRRSGQGPFDDRSHRRLDPHQRPSLFAIRDAARAPARQGTNVQLSVAQPEASSRGRGARRFRCRHRSPTRAPGPRHGASSAAPPEL